VKDTFFIFKILANKLFENQVILASNILDVLVLIKKVNFISKLTQVYLNKTKSLFPKSFNLKLDECVKI
jgi:hypothetical protein